MTAVLVAYNHPSTNHLESGAGVLFTDGSSDFVLIHGAVFAPLYTQTWFKDFLESLPSNIEGHSNNSKLANRLQINILQENLPERKVSFNLNFLEFKTKFSDGNQNRLEMPDRKQYRRNIITRLDNRTIIPGSSCQTTDVRLFNPIQRRNTPEPQISLQTSSPSYRTAPTRPWSHYRIHSIRESHFYQFPKQRNCKQCRWLRRVSNFDGRADSNRLRRRPYFLYNSIQVKTFLKIAVFSQIDPEVEYVCFHKS